MQHSSPSPVDLYTGWRRWLIASLISATLAFGFMGNWRYETERHPGHVPDVFSVLYHSCQLLIVHGVHLEGHVPWQLHVGRLLGAVALFAAGFAAFAKFFRNEMMMVRLRWPWQRDHIVVCGLGNLGLRLALDARRRGKFVVAVENQAEAAAISEARKNSVLVVEGEACDAALLRKVRVERAEFVVAACPEDSMNVAIAATVRRVLPPALQRRQPLVCRLLIRDPDLRRLLDSESVFGTAYPYATESNSTTAGNYLVNFKDLNPHDTAARQAIRWNPFDFHPILKDDDKTVHLVIVGFGPMGQSLLLHAARIGHFANGVTADRRIRISVVDRFADAGVDAFRSRFPKIDNVCDLHEHDVVPTGSAFLQALDDFSRDAVQRNELVTYCVCLESEQVCNDHENMRIGMSLSRLGSTRPVQLLVYQSTRCGFAALFPAEGSTLNSRLHAFGMIEDVYSWDVLLHESEDRLARALHEDYVKNRRRDGQNDDEWDQLPEGLRESNRNAADHISIKLRGLGYYDAPLQPGRPRIEQFSSQEILLLAQMEHRRWCAERWLDGWEHGPKTIRDNKINENLVPWQDLRPEEQKKDPEQIMAIPHVLYSIGRGIYR